MAPPNCNRNDSSQAMESISRWLVGSSNSSRSGWLAKARASKTRRCMPPDRVSAPVLGIKPQTAEYALEPVLNEPYFLFVFMPAESVAALALEQADQQIAVLAQARGAYFIDLAPQTAGNVLGQMTHAKAGFAADLAGIWAYLAGQQLEHAGLARAVAAHQTDPFTLIAPGN